MILAPLKNPEMEAVVRAVVRPGEDVVTAPEQTIPAVLLGFPRLGMVQRRGALFVRAMRDAGVPTLELEEVSRYPDPSDPDEARRRMANLVAEHARKGGWGDSLLNDLVRVSGGPLPAAFVSFARRPLEYPRRYCTVADLARPLRMSRGALNQAFQRSAVPSPGGYLRWLRLFTVAHLLTDPEMTTARAAHRLGFQSSGTLCRSVQSLTNAGTDQLRRDHTHERLLVQFVSEWLQSDQRSAWSELDDLFAIAA